MDKFYVEPWFQKTYANPNDPEEVRQCGFLIMYRHNSIKHIYFEPEANYICKELNKALSKGIN